MHEKRNIKQISRTLMIEGHGDRSQNRRDLQEWGRLVERVRHYSPVLVLHYQDFQTVVTDAVDITSSYESAIVLGKVPLMARVGICLGCAGA